MKGLRRIERLALACLVRRENMQTEWHGTAYGGWSIPAGLLDSRSIVYSGGVGEDASFDLSVIQRYGCTVYAFDPTPRSVTFAATIADARFKFVPVGLWSEDGEQPFRGPANPEHVSHTIAPNSDAVAFTAQCRSIASLTRELGHDMIDLLKVDIEGAEHEVLPSMLDKGVRPRVVCVELHGGLWRALSLTRSIRAAGYVPVAVDGWNVTFVRGGIE